MTKCDAISYIQHAFSLAFGRLIVDNLTMQKFVFYARVSTSKQSDSGLGLDGQRAAATAYVASVNGRILAEYVEVESGRKNDRAQLTLALDHARKTGASLLVGKLDRVSRNLAFIANLLESGVGFVAADMPSADRAMLQVRGVFAELEARAISDRTKLALAQAKARGTLLGAARPGAFRFGADQSRRAAEGARAAATVKARAAALDVADRIRELRAQGFSLRDVCSKLTAEGYVTRRGNAYGPTQVSRIEAMQVAA